MRTTRTYVASDRSGKRRDYIITGKLTKHQDTAIRKEIAKEKLIIERVTDTTYGKARD
jgi:hypothetical protein